MAISQVLAKRFRLAASALAVYAAVITSVSIALGDDFVKWSSVTDVALFLGLAYGVYRKSRVAAIVLFAYHLLNRLLTYRLTGELGSLLGLAPLTYAFIFFLGILGVFSHPRVSAERREDLKASTERM